MAISKIEMRPEGSNYHADVLYPKTSIDVIDGLGDWSIATGVNSYVITEDGITTLVPGVRVTVKFTNASTGTCTLKINSLSAKSITKPGGGTINIKANGVYTLVYDGTAFQLQGEGGEYGNATASDVKVGKTIGTDGGIVTGTFTSDATIPSDAYMYQGVTAYANGVKLTGTMPIRTIGGTITTQGGSVNIAYGYTDGGTITASFPNLVAENIKSGVNVGGVVGNYKGAINLSSNTDMIDVIRQSGINKTYASYIYTLLLSPNVYYSAGVWKKVIEFKVPVSGDYRLYSNFVHTDVDYSRALTLRIKYNGTVVNTGGLGIYVDKYTEGFSDVSIANLEVDKSYVLEGMTWCNDSYSPRSYYAYLTTSINIGTPTMIV